MNTLPHASTPYDELSESMSTNLLSVVHFALLFHAELKIPPHALLFPTPEDSLLNGSGAVFDALQAHVSITPGDKAWLRNCDSDTRVAHLQYALAAVSDADAVRAHMLTAEGRVAPSARLRAGARDGCGIGYVWVRGADGCASARIAAGGRVWAGEDVRHVAEAVEIRGRCGGGRADLLVALWLRDRIDVSDVRAERVMSMWKEEVEREKEAERRRAHTLERIGVDGDGYVLMAGEKVAVGQFGRGRRERRQISYAEKIQDECDELEGMDEDDEDDDDEDDFVLDGPDDDEDDGELDEYDSGGEEQLKDDDLERMRNGNGQMMGQRKRLKKDGGSWARQDAEPQAVGRRRVRGQGLDLESTDLSSRAGRAARRGRLKDGECT